VAAQNISYKKSESGWLGLFVCLFVCVLQLLCSGGVFFGVRSGDVAWQRHLDNLKRFLWGPFWGFCWAAAQQWGGIFFGVRSEGI
jgi:hypothetical protein